MSLCLIHNILRNMLCVIRSVNWLLWSLPAPRASISVCAYRHCWHKVMHHYAGKKQPATKVSGQIT